MAEVTNTTALASKHLAIDEVYLRRARQLAERPAATAESATVPVLVFRLGTERYGIELSELAEVFPYRTGTEILGATRSGRP